MKIMAMTLACLVALMAFAQNESLQKNEQKKKPVLPPLESKKPKQDAAKEKLLAELKDKLPPDLEQQKGDLVQRFPKTNPLLGIWKVKQQAFVVGRGTGQTSGYIIITRTHISRHLILEAPFKKLDFQNMFGTYLIQGNALIISTLMGMASSDKPGELLLVPQGRRERRRFQLMTPTLLRIYQTSTRFLDFTKMAEL